MTLIVIWNWIPYISQDSISQSHMLWINCVYMPCPIRVKSKSSHLSCLNINEVISWYRGNVWNWKWLESNLNLHFVFRHLTLQVIIVSKLCSWRMLTLLHLLSQNVQTHFKNLAANAARYLKCVCPFWDIMH